MEGPALEVLRSALNDADVNVRRSVAWALGKMGEQALTALSCLLDDGETAVRRAAVRALGKIGEPALEVLPRMLNDTSSGVRLATVYALGEIGNLALRVLSDSLNHEDADVREAVIHVLGNIGEPALEILSRALSHPDPSVWGEAINALGMIGEPALGALVGALEDYVGQRSHTVADYLSGYECSIKPDEVKKAIIHELIDRGSDRPRGLFNPKIVTEVLQGTIRRAPQLGSEVQEKLCSLAYRPDTDLRQRVVAVARGLGADEFASLVKARAKDDPSVARTIMHLLGGGEAAAFFSELQGQALARYRAPLLRLERVSLRRWHDLTGQARWSFYISMGMSVGLFLVGITIVVWGLLLLTQSDDPSQKIGGGVISALSVLATTLSSRFWKDPVEHIQSFSAQQSRLQAAFIGYMNIVAQIRLVFENAYERNEITMDDLATYHSLLSSAITQASRELVDRRPASSVSAEAMYTDERPTAPPAKAAFDPLQTIDSRKDPGRMEPN
jgi:HEAT repeat protein